MAIAWLLCECVIKKRSETLSFINKNNLNSFVLKKTTSKCSDSFRLSDEDKEMLKKLRD